MGKLKSSKYNKLWYEEAKKERVFSRGRKEEEAKTLKYSPSFVRSVTAMCVKNMKDGCLVVSATNL